MEIGVQTQTLQKRVSVFRVNCMNLLLLLHTEEVYLAIFMRT
jgi:hypothetical protein